MAKIKTPDEIETLRVGGRILATILETLAGEVKPGISTADLNDRANELIKELGEIGDKAAFLDHCPEWAERTYPSTLCTSVNEEIVHGVSNEEPTVLKEGDIVGLDMGLIHNGLYTDHAITVPVGKISEEAKKLIKVTREALDAGIKQAQVGNTIGDIGFAIESLVSKAGFTVAEGLAGHGVGHDVHEEPFVPNEGTPGDGEDLVEGMVIAIEPMVNVGKPGIILEKDGFTYRTTDRSLSAHFEHTVAITKDGPRIMTVIKDCRRFQ